MNVSEACTILEVSEGCPEEEVNKSFRKFAAKYHPDTNKESDAEEKFKKINEAYQFLKDNGTIPKQQPHPFINPINFNDFFSAFNAVPTQNSSFNFFFGRQPQPKLIHRVIHKLTFLESVKSNGLTKQVEFDRKFKCNKCNGTKKSGDINCPDCQGIGTITKKHNISFMYRREHNCINFGGEGDYQPQSNQYCDLQLVFDIAPDPYFKIDPRNSNNIISDIKISLLEAVAGKSVNVNTVQGEKKLKIPPKTKNGDIIRINGYGTNASGAHLFNIEILYPEDTDALIKFLETNSSGKDNQSQ
jgi:molecular chaperone DnaJ